MLPPISRATKKTVVWSALYDIADPVIRTLPLGNDTTDFEVYELSDIRAFCPPVDTPRWVPFPDLSRHCVMYPPDVVMLEESAPSNHNRSPEILAGVKAGGRLIPHFCAR
jgi:hypothetical protein